MQMRAMFVIYERASARLSILERTRGQLRGIYYFDQEFNTRIDCCQLFNFKHNLAVIPLLETTDDFWWNEPNRSIFVFVPSWRGRSFEYENETNFNYGRRKNSEPPIIVSTNSMKLIFSARKLINSITGN